jgi:hypothetical protein
MKNMKDMKDVGAREKAPFRAAESIYERFWSGMGTRNDEPRDLATTLRR